MTPRTYIFHADPGHAWLQVELSEVYRLGLAQTISGYSYVNGTDAYLEEDCDASAFLEAKRARGEVYELRHMHRNNTPIRRYNRYVPSLAVIHAPLSFGGEQGSLPL